MAAQALPAVSLRRVTQADVPALARLYAAAFADNPAYTSVFAELRGASLEAALAWLLAKRCDLLLATHAPFLCAVTGDGQILAAAAVELRENTRLELVQAGVLGWPFLWGLASLRRALASPRHAPPGSPEVRMVAVSPATQRKGLGGAVLDAVLAEFDALRTGRGLVLGTQKEVNCGFYERRGFVRDHELNSDGEWTTSWVMTRPAQETAKA